MHNVGRSVLALFVAAFAIPLLAQPAAPSLYILTSGVESRLEPRQAGFFLASVTNAGTATATNVALTITLPLGGTIVSVEPMEAAPACTLTNNTLVCTVPSLAPQRTFSLSVAYAAPDRTDGADFVFRSVVTAAEADADPSDNEKRTVAAMVRHSGLRLHPNCDTEVRGLAVNSFPGYGVVIRRLPAGETDQCLTPPFVIHARVQDNYLGTDASGRIAKPNQRGLGVFTLTSTVRDNLISGNARAGLYAAEGFLTEITDNTIAGNGAGIFFDMGDSRAGMPGGADVYRNVIAVNRGMAIARTRRGEIHITQNSIFDNLQQGIDVDVDGVSPQRDHDVDVPNAPILISATFLPGPHYTVIRGRLDSETVASTRTIEVFKSARLSVWGTAQAEHSVIRHSVLSGQGRIRDLRARRSARPVDHRNAHGRELPRRNPASARSGVRLARRSRSGRYVGAEQRRSRSMNQSR